MLINALLGWIHSRHETKFTKSPFWNRNSAKQSQRFSKSTLTFPCVWEPHEWTISTREGWLAINILITVVLSLPVRSRIGFWKKYSCFYDLCISFFFFENQPKVIQWNHSGDERKMGKWSNTLLVLSKLNKNPLHYVDQFQIATEGNRFHGPGGGKCFALNRFWFLFCTTFAQCSFWAWVGKRGIW